jgi:hypothetical protein
LFAYFQKFFNNNNSIRRDIREFSLDNLQLEDKISKEDIMARVGVANGDLKTSI